MKGKDIQIGILINISITAKIEAQSIRVQSILSNKEDDQDLGDKVFQRKI